MIEREDFIDLINSIKEQEKRVDTLDSVFSSAFDNPIIDWGYKMFDKLINLYFNKEGVDWVSYYLWDNPERCYYANGLKRALETPEDLWEIIKEYRI